jgi:flagellum-specific peptidoglycan hydrolase FlgJ
MKRLTLFIILFLFCNFKTSKRGQILESIKQKHVSIYINSIWNDAQFIENVYGIPIELVIAQSCLETNYGRSNLCQNHCNYFGIQGFKFYSKSECFIKYGDMLTCLPCYANLQPKTLEQWYDALICCNYAEGKPYVNQLKRIINDYLTLKP